MMGRLIFGRPLSVGSVTVPLVLNITERRKVVKPKANVFSDMPTIIGAPLRYIVLSEAKPYERGAGQAIVNMLSSAGQLIGGALIGGIIASFSGIFGYKISLILAAIVAFIAFLFTLKLKNRDEQVKTMLANQ